MNLKKHWTLDVGFAFIVVGLLWLLMLGSIGFVFGVSFIVIGSCTILINYLLPSKKR